MKNIIIYGSSRSGKTQLAKMIAQTYHYNIVMVDSLVSAFQNSMPDLKINHIDRTGETIKNLEPFLLSYLKSINKIDKKARGINYVVEGSYFDIDKLLELKNKFVLIILISCFEQPVGYYNALRKYDKEYDWTCQLSNEELVEYSDNLYQHNKYLIMKCDEFNLRYYDTAQNRKKTFKHIIRNLKTELIE